MCGRVDAASQSADDRDSRASQDRREFLRLLPAVHGAASRANDRDGKFILRPDVALAIQQQRRIADAFDGLRVLGRTARSSLTPSLWASSSSCSASRPSFDAAIDIAIFGPMPSTSSSCVRLAASTPAAEPKWSSSSCECRGPMPLTKCSRSRLSNSSLVDSGVSMRVVRKSGNNGCRRSAQPR